MTTPENNITDSSLAPQGRQKINWVKEHMPVVGRLSDTFSQELPFKNYRIGLSIHLEAKTARLAISLRDAGGDIAITSSNPLSTQDDVAAALDEEENIDVYAKRGVDEDTYEGQLQKVLQTKPHLIIDDGGDLVEQLHGPLEELSERVIGGCEETTTGIHRLKALENQNLLNFPMFGVNDAKMKYLFDNRYGTGQSTWDAIMRTTNLSVAGSTAVVVGYGWCGKGIAKRAEGLGASVIVVEVDPIKAIEAKMDGYQIMNIEEAAPKGDFFITSTSCKNAIPEEALQKIKDGSILANSGHFNVEIDLESLKEMSRKRSEVRENIARYDTNDGRAIYVLGEGRLVNLVAGDGHPAEIMDISFALQMLTTRHLVENSGDLESKLHSVPEHIDRKVAETKLETMGIEIDHLSEEQKEYLEHWS